jgi:D-alanyl-D-alanine dipeptidase
MRISFLFFLPLFVVVGCQPAPSSNDTEIPEEVTTIIKEDTIVPQSYVKPTPVPPDYDTTKWTDIAYMDSTILLDIRYATENNFVETQMYDCGRCFLRPDVAKAIGAVQKVLQREGLGLKMFDCFRPRPIQWKLWEKVPDPRYVSDPRKGSMHNRGAAVDLTIVDTDGQELDMGTGFDFFGQRAYHTFTDLPEEILANRAKLKALMEAHGFKSIRTEWWHYSYTKSQHALSDMLWNCPIPDFH